MLVRSLRVLFCILKAGVGFAVMMAGFIVPFAPDASMIGSALLRLFISGSGILFMIFSIKKMLRVLEAHPI